MSCTDFIFGANCTQTKLLTDAIHAGASNSAALLRPLLNDSSFLVHFNDSALSVQLKNQLFQINLIGCASLVCGKHNCFALDFTGNADIAGIGVSDVARSSHWNAKAGSSPW